MTSNQMVHAVKLTEEDNGDTEKIIPPCFRLPILSLLVPFFVGLIEPKPSKTRNLIFKNSNDLFQTVEEEEEEDIGGDNSQQQQQEEEDLKRLALEISIGDLGYSPPHQVSVGSCDTHQGEVISCSTMAESSDESPQETTMIEPHHRCGNCNFTISLHWRFCPECGVYIEGITIITQMIHTLDLSQLESNVDTPKREESFMEELLEGLE